MYLSLCGVGEALGQSHPCCAPEGEGQSPLVCVLFSSGIVLESLYNTDRWERKMALALSLCVQVCVCARMCVLVCIIVLCTCMYTPQTTPHHSHTHQIFRQWCVFTRQYMECGEHRHLTEQSDLSIWPSEP